MTNSFAARVPARPQPARGQDRARSPPPREPASASPPRSAPSKKARASSSATSTSAGCRKRLDQLGAERARGARQRHRTRTTCSGSSTRRVEFGGGQLDVLVNNAGLGGTATLAEMTDEQWFSVLDVTLTGTMRMTRAALRHMRGQRGGAIVNNASVVGWRAQEGQSHYAAAKAGVMALTRCAAIEAAAEQRARQRGRAVARDASVPRQGHDRGTPRRARDARSVRARGRAVGGRERDRLPRQRPRVVHDRRGRLGQQPAPLAADGHPVALRVHGAHVFVL